MRATSFALLAALGLLMVGCGGGAPASYVPGYYRGTAIIAAENGESGTAPVVMDIQANGDFSAHAFGDTVDARIIKVGGNGILETTSQIGGTAFLRQRPGDLAFGYSSRANAEANGSVVLTPFPAFGATVTVPPAGSYSGEALTISEGRVRSLGRVTATVQADGTWLATAVGAYPGNGDYAGQFQTGGMLTTASFTQNSETFPQPTDPQFSFDSATLVVRYALPLESTVVWLTLSPN